jgi:hypothetical protein
MAIGFAVGSALLLSAASIVPGLHARDQRMYARYGTFAGRRAPNALLVWYLHQSVGDLDITADVADPVGEAPIPPGLSRVPAPGEIFVSERLAELWDQVGPTLERRLQGHLAGTIDQDGVDGPDQVLLWMGKPHGVRLARSDAPAIRSFDARPSSFPVDLLSLLTSIVVASALLLPIWLFVATATRLSAATREQRLAAVRLTGGTEAQVRLLAAAEAGVPAAVGALAGIALFIWIRPLLAGGFLGGTQLYPSDLTPAVSVAVALLLALPLLAIVMSLVTMRRLIVTPLGVARRARRSHAGWRWILVLAPGIAVLAWSASQHARLARFDDVTVSFIVGSSLACIAFGLVGTATWAAWATARRLARSVRSVPAMLGLRRLEADPSSVSRVVGGVAILIALLGVVQSGLISVERSEGPPILPTEAQLLSGDEVGVWDGRIDPSSVDLQGIPGVSSVRWTHKLPFGRSGLPIGVIQTDGTASTLEAIRDRLAWSGAEIHTLAQVQEQAKLANDDYSSFGSGAVAITLFLLLVSAATLLVAMVDWMMERRRSLAVLSAVGVSSSTVRRSILIQVTLPLMASIVFGLVGAIIVTTLLYTAVEQPLAMAWRQLITLVGVVILVVLAVTASSAPWLRIARRPELLRES